jgi:hypothetical protein
MTILGILSQVEAARPIPAEAPIGGFFWSVVLPALLLAVAFVGTLLLYRRFAGQEGKDRS